MALTDNDASGGAGSITQQLLGIAVNGISRAADSYASRKFPLTSFNDTSTKTATGKNVPTTAPQAPATASEKVASVFANPYVQIAGVATLVGAVGFVIYKIVTR